MFRLTTRLTAVLFVALAFSQVSLAQVGVGAHVGYDIDVEEVVVGVNGMFKIPVQIGDQFARLNPEFSYYLTSDGEDQLIDTSIWLAAVNFIYPFGLTVADFYGGVGLELTRISVSTDLDTTFGKASSASDFSDSETKIGANIKIGAAISLLFAEVGYHLRSDIGGPYAQGGLRLMVGG
jgi:opacity protein-like surface antigen